MDIFFSNKTEEQLCSDERKASRRLGSKGTRKLLARLADLRAAACVSDLVAGRPHPLKHDRLGQFAIDLDGGCRLVFEPASDPVPRTDDGSVAWREVTAVRILLIGDYYD